MLDAESMGTQYGVVLNLDLESDLGLDGAGGRGLEFLCCLLQL